MDYRLLLFEKLWKEDGRSLEEFLNYSRRSGPRPEGETPTSLINMSSNSSEEGSKIPIPPIFPPCSNFSKAATCDSFEASSITPTPKIQTSNFKSSATYSEVVAGTHKTQLTPTISIPSTSDNSAVPTASNAKEIIVAPTIAIPTLSSITSASIGPPEKIQDFQAGLRDACTKMRQICGAPRETIALEWAMLQKKEAETYDLTQENNIANIEDKFILGKELTFKDFEEMMELPKKEMIENRNRFCQPDIPLFINEEPFEPFDEEKYRRKLYIEKFVKLQQSKVAPTFPKIQIDGYETQAEETLLESEPPEVLKVAVPPQKITLEPDQLLRSPYGYDTPDSLSPFYKQGSKKSNSSSGSARESSLSSSSVRSSNTEENSSSDESEVSEARALSSKRKDNRDVSSGSSSSESEITDNEDLV